MHPSYRQLFYAHAERAVLFARAVAGTKHKGLKGELREIIVRQLLRPFLPPVYDIGSGEIISAYGDTSAQTDIVVCDKRIAPPLLIGADKGFFPIETVIASIEVKSVLTNIELKKSEAAAAHVATFAHAPPKGGVRTIPRIEHVVPFIFALRSSLKAGSETSSLDRIYRARGSSAPAVRGLCIVDRGYWYWDDNAGTWTKSSTATPYSDVAHFVADIVSLADRVARTREQPDLAMYLG